MKRKAPWLMASIMTVFIAVIESGTILKMIPGTTIVDVGVLAVTGFLAGLFLGFHVKQRREFHA